MRLDTAFVKHADTTYCGTSLGQSQDIVNWSKKERFTPGLPHCGSSGACEQKYMRGTVRLGWRYRQQFGIPVSQKMMRSDPGSVFHRPEKGRRGRNQTATSPRLAGIVGAGHASLAGMRGKRGQSLLPCL